MGSFKLDPVLLADEARQGIPGSDGLTGTVLLQNALWFTRIRWIVIVVLLAFGTVGLGVEPQLLRSLGLPHLGSWPFLLAALLTTLNLGSIRWVHRLLRRTPCTSRDVAVNIWFQITTDLAVLTVLVYRVGPTSSVIAFAYLFHITLACIFFGRRDSFLVTLLSVLLFLATVILQLKGTPPPSSLSAGAQPGMPDFLPAAVFALPTVFVWMIVWYLVAYISDAVRLRDRDLDAANRRLTRADEEKNMQMMRVTHDLKAPFSGIESCIQILKHNHWDETPESVRQVIGKIEARSTTLRSRIGDILTLGNLRSMQTREQVIEPVNLRSLLGTVLNDVQGLAANKKVTVRLTGDEVPVRSDAKQLKSLFSNLVSNAVVYSLDQGVVDVTIESGASSVRVRVADQGIGISESKLPNIFDDFFRTQEAAAFNPNSTGLGLAIVRQIARNLRLTIAVESEQGKGTAFDVFIPLK